MNKKNSKFKLKINLILNNHLHNNPTNSPKILFRSIMKMMRINQLNKQKKYQIFLLTMEVKMINISGLNP